MNVRLQYDLEFMGAIYFEERLQLNNYNVNLRIQTQTTDTMCINIAMERLKCFVYSELADVVFISQEHKSQAQLFQALGCNVCTLPNDPVDQMVGMMLYCKLNAIMENVMRVTTVDFSSSLGDNVWYSHDEEDGLGQFNEDGWWHKPTTQKETLNIEEPTTNIVKVQNAGWNEFGLGWPGVNLEKSAKIVYPDFNKDATK